MKSTISRALLSLALCCVAGTAEAQQPASLDQRIAKLVELRKQRADIEKAEAALMVEIRNQFKDLVDRLAELGIGPGPIPPAPPKPDELRDKLTAAFKADKGTKDEAKKLASIYAEAANLVLKKSAKGGYTITSSLQLIETIRDVANDGDWIGPDALPATRAFIASLWVPIFGEEPTTAPLTDAQRASVADVFTRVAAALEGL